MSANRALGHPADARDYAVAAAILCALGLARVRLLSNNPAKAKALAAHGIAVQERVPLLVPNPHNAAYLAAKRNRLQHVLPR